MTELALHPVESSLGSDIARLAGVILSTHYPSADRAALRRWAPGQTIPMAFYRLWLRHLHSDLPNPQQSDAWMTLSWGLATMGQDANDPTRSLGQVLAESRFSEGRLERLLSAPEDVRVDLFMDAVRFLAAKNERFDWLDAAQFLLTTNSAKREGIHRRVATAFYRYLPKES